MTTRPSLSALALVLFLALSPVSAHAEGVKPDDTVSFDLSAESWVSTKSAQVTLNVAAAVSSSNAGSTRTNMAKAVDDVVKADWRLTSFNRMQDPTGMERWSASYEARIPENNLNGLAEKAKALSKTGMQLTIGQIDFSPTLEETQTALSQLRTEIYKQANEQLTTLNTSIPARGYRIASITFNGQQRHPMFMEQNMRVAKAMRSTGSSLMSPASDDASTESASMARAEKLVLTAQITLAAEPKAPAATK